ncbi:MAG: ABC transporter ATP-binding protein [Actinobacteria bacterium QS_8_72_14]|nr:MAG: ABC transporter ATP-binding protein [Actinobacteria bacterium QS_8_72_14]
MLKEGASPARVREETGHVAAVAGVSLDIPQGEVFVVMGLSGSGKSTLIRCVNRLLEPTDGEVVVDGETVTEYDLQQVRQFRREKTSMVFQHFALFPHKSVLDNVAYGLKVQDVAEEKRNERAMEALRLVGLADWGDRYPHNLSGGMQQRVGLARGLATDPDILLMDEAFSALDPLIRRQMQNELLSLRLGSRVMIMKEGKVIQVGTPTEIVTEPADQYVADFMADVDHAKVLPTSFAMREVATFAADASVAEAADTIRSRGSCFLVDDNKQPVGLVTADAVDGATGSLRAIATQHFPVASDTARIAELFHLASEGRPIAVVDEEDRRLLGSVSPYEILRVLGEVEVVDYAPQTTEETR